MKLLVTLPLPHKILHPNGRTRNHRYKGVLTKQARGDAKLAGIAARREAGHKTPWERAYLVPVFHVKHHQAMDDDGLTGWLKAYRDGLADAGIVTNDKGIQSCPPILVNGSKEPRVEIELTEQI